MSAREQAEHARICSLPFGHQGGHWWDEQQDPPESHTPSIAAYWRHRRNSEEPCQPCKTAAYKHIRQRAAERQKALQLLAAEYPKRYRELLRQIRHR